MTTLEETKALVDDLVSQTPSQMKWTWGEGLFGYALSLLDEAKGTDDYLPFLLEYGAYWAKQNPEVNSSDTSAPCLITYYLYKKTGKKEFADLTGKAIHYLENSPRVIGDIPNHMGTSFNARFFPSSIWVDSLMMFSVFPSLYGKENHEERLLHYAAKLPAVFAQYLQDPQKGLFYHEYLVKKGRPYPQHDLFWGRGNGWVIAALPMVYANLPEGYPEKEDISSIYLKTFHAMMAHQNPDGSFNTLLCKKSYRELSATALFAAGAYQGLNEGILPKGGPEERSAKNAAEAVFKSLRKNKKGHWEFPEISGPTCPLPPFPGLNYKMIPRKANWSYGVAALIFLALQKNAYEAIDPVQRQ
jgi:unsaturated rhamnogalacturonyl hydrolase